MAAFASSGLRREATSVQRQLDAQRNEELVLAESALHGERRASLVRVFMMIGFAVSRGVIGPVLGGLPHHLDTTRNVIGFSYAAFALLLYFLLRTQQPDPRRALVFPLLTCVIDIVFVSAMGMRTYSVEHEFYPAMSAASLMVVMSYSVCRAGVHHVVFATVLACVAFLVQSRWTHSFDWGASTFVLAAFLALGAFLAVTNRSVHATFRDLRARDNLSRFLPRQIVDRVLAHGDSALRPVQTDVTVLFSDLRDFTTLSERMSPRELLELLDDYFAHMSQIVKAHDGLVNKFIGDGMLAFWNVPEHTPDHAERALRAALDMRARLAEINAVREKRQLAPLRFGIGIHSGPVAAGMLGGADQHEYTVIGDAVNVASRIEGLTKTLGVDILVSEATKGQVGERFATRRLGDQQVKGRAGPIAVHALEDGGGRET
jgi:adenylate cyclase